MGESPSDHLSPHPKLPWHRVPSTILSGSIGMWMRTACAVNTKPSARTTMWCCVAGEVGPPVCSGLWLTLWGGCGSRGARDGTSPAIKAGCWPENMVPEPSWGRGFRDGTRSGLPSQAVPVPSRTGVSSENTSAATPRRRWWPAPPAGGCLPTTPSS